MRTKRRPCSAGICYPFVMLLFCGNSGILRNQLKPITEIDERTVLSMRRLLASGWRLLLPDVESLSRLRRGGEARAGRGGSRAGQRVRPAGDAGDAGNAGAPAAGRAGAVKLLLPRMDRRHGGRRDATPRGTAWWSTFSSTRWWPIRSWPLTGTPRPTALTTGW